MTICLSTICDRGKTVIVASDKMLTHEYLSIEFDHETPKIEQLGKSCVALTAGDAIVPNELFRLAKQEIRESDSIHTIAEKVKTKYALLRLKRAEELHVKTRGFKDASDFYKQANDLPPQIVVPIDDNVQSHKLGLEVMIAGVDDAGAHIWDISNPGIAQCMDSIGFHSMGSGEPHSEYCFIGNGFNRNILFKQALFLSYEAKRRAESAPGVGQSTDILVITPNQIITITKDIIQELEKAYQIKRGIEEEKKKQIDSILLSIKVDGL